MSAVPEETFQASGNGVSASADATPTAKLPRDDLVRSAASFNLADDDGEEVVMEGRFTPFNEWTEIHSMFEGHFMERIAEGAFSKSFAEKTPKVLFQHGADPLAGDKPIGLARSLEERSDGAYYEVPLFDASYVRDLIPGLRAGAYGASFRFRVMNEKVDKRPEPTDSNPEGLPERTITEAMVHEFGPVTFPAYDGATAGVRSLTDEFRAIRDLPTPEEGDEEPQPPSTPEETQPEPESATTAEGAATETNEPLYGLPRKEGQSWRL